ncbi:MAG: hypothetical protein LBJ70_04375 [Holosporales bacterium]|jgi:hypothetical protein|nr:hypothetical protein [Holosporales bacterium]
MLPLSEETCVKIVKVVHLLSGRDEKKLWGGHFFQRLRGTEQDSGYEYCFNCYTRRFRTFCSTTSQYSHTLQAARPELLEIAEFVKTHDLSDVHARFNTVPRMFDYLLETIAKRPDITFHFFIPPHCAICLANKGSFTSYIGGLLYLLNAVEHFPNIHIYAFDDVPEIVCNTANYMDAGHYGIGVARYILKAMRVGKHRVTKENVLAYLRRVAETLLSFDPTPDLEHTVSFEGPLNESVEEAFTAIPPPMGPSPLSP